MGLQHRASKATSSIGFEIGLSWSD
jgi:hypothetical protein